MSSFLNLFNYCGFLKILTVIFQFHSFNFCKTVSVSTSACPFLFPWLFFYGLSLHPLRSTLPPTVSASIFYLLTPKSFISSHCLSSSTSMTSYPEFSPKFFSDRFNKTRTEQLTLLLNSSPSSLQLTVPVNRHLLRFSTSVFCQVLPYASISQLRFANSFRFVLNIASKSSLLVHPQDNVLFMPSADITFWYAAFLIHALRCPSHVSFLALDVQISQSELRVLQKVISDISIFHLPNFESYFFMRCLVSKPSPSPGPQSCMIQEGYNSPKPQRYLTFVLDCFPAFLASASFLRAKPTLFLAFKVSIFPWPLMDHQKTVCNSWPLF